ncbi:MAG TPA: LysR substrate-binding domain-containing protein [Aliidongia sp.]|uniref:LysR substrate-binding domain-containing protein n=1 Tax=Aliidongia sp. TaxID=1914230 RepID=UPI002DDDA9E9|nr:LysR substrate-binding domain-containing protein [Aliidongia sp.]HEV2675768.1 LysR substrate-binding domain-containing protein [Aliidongia sp.]
MDLDLDSLRAFLAIVDTGGFSRAARVLRRSQSAVSAQIRRLEEALGAAVFDRTGRLPVLTLDGEALIGTARQMVELNDQVMSRGRRGAVRGMVRLGAMDDYATDVLPGVLRRFAQAFPEVGVELQSGLTVELAQRLGVGLDLVLVMHGAGSHRGRILQRDRAVWAAAPDFALPDGPVPLAVAPRGCLFREWAMAALDRADRPWRIAYLTQSIGAASAAVAAGLAVGVFKAALMPSGLVPLGSAQGFPPLPDIEIALHRSAGHAAPAVTALGDFIEANLVERASAA